MFLKDEKKSPGWGLVVLGLVLCAFSLVGISGMLGALSGTGRLATLVVIGIPAGAVSVVIGLVMFYRGDRGERRRR